MSVSQSEQVPQTAATAQVTQPNAAVNPTPSAEAKAPEQAAFGYQAINVPQSVPIPSLGDGANKAASASSQAIYPAIPGLDHIQPFSSFASFSLPRGGPLPPPRASPYSFVQQQAGQSGHGNGLSQYTLSSRPQQPASSQTSASNSPVSTYAPSPSASTSFRFDSPNTSLDSHSSNSSTNSPNQSYDHYFYSAYQHIKPAPADDDDSWHGGLFDRTAASASPPAGTQHMSTHWQQNLSPQVAQSHGAAPDPMFRDQLFGWAAPSRTSLSPQPTSLPFRPTFQPQHNYTYPRAPHPQSMPQYMPSHASNQSQAANAYSVDQFINYSSSSAISPISQGRHDLGRRDLLNQALGVPTVGPAAQSEIKQNPKRKRGGSEVPQQSHSGQEVGSEQDAPGEDDPSFTTTGTGHHPDLASALKRQRTDPTSASLSPNLLQLEALKPAISSAIMGHVAVPFPGQGYSTDATPEQQAGQASTSAQPASQPDPVEVYIRVVPGECEGAAKTFACLAEGCEKRSYKTRNGIVQHVTNCHVNEGSYECSFADCNEKFGSKKDRSKHERTHKTPKSARSKSEKIYFCACGKGYVLPMPFQTHKASCQAAADADSPEDPDDVQAQSEAEASPGA